MDVWNKPLEDFDDFCDRLPILIARHKIKGWQFKPASNVPRVEIKMHGDMSYRSRGVRLKTPWKREHILQFAMNSQRSILFNVLSYRYSGVGNKLDGSAREYLSRHQYSKPQDYECKFCFPELVKVEPLIVKSRLLTNELMLGKRIDAYWSWYTARGLEPLLGCLSFLHEKESSPCEPYRGVHFARRYS